jgi:hypothetical protein
MCALGIVKHKTDGIINLNMYVYALLSVPSCVVSGGVEGNDSSALLFIKSRCIVIRMAHMHSNESRFTLQHNNLRENS